VSRDSGLARATGETAGEHRDLNMAIAHGPFQSETLRGALDRREYAQSINAGASVALRTASLSPCLPLV
jgi:hypothetical protein